MSATAILAVIKAIPALTKLFSEVMDLFYKQQAAKIDNEYDVKKVSRDAILFKMKQPGATDEQLKNYRRALYDLNH